MWKVLWDVWNGLWTLLRNSPFAFWLSLALIAVSLVELFTKNTWWKERGLKVTVAVISVVLLIVQAWASGKASEKEAANLNTALTQQRNELTQTLTQAFTVGTNKTLEGAAQTAEQTRKSARDQTDAIRRQATQNLTQLQGSMVGTSQCPGVAGSILRPNGRPDGIVVFNTDRKLNMYDVRVELIEYGPGAAGGPWSTILQDQTLAFPLIPPDHSSTHPFTFLSQMTNIDVQVLAFTRTKICGLRIYLVDKGGNVWVNDPKATLADSKPEP